MEVTSKAIQLSLLTQLPTVINSDYSEVAYWLYTRRLFVAIVSQNNKCVYVVKLYFYLLRILLMFIVNQHFCVYMGDML